MVEKSTAIKVVGVSALIVVSVILGLFFVFGTTNNVTMSNGAPTVGEVDTVTATGFINGMTVSVYVTPNGGAKSLVGSCMPANIVNNYGSCSVSFTVTSTMIGTDGVEATQGAGGNTGFTGFSVSSSSTTTTTTTSTTSNTGRGGTTTTAANTRTTTNNQVTTSTSLVNCYTLVACTLHFREPPGMQYPNWALNNVTVEALGYSPVQPIGLSGANIQGINSTVQISSISYNDSAIQIEYSQNVSVSLQIPSNEPPVTVYSDGNLINTWTYSNGVLSIVADPYTVSIFYSSSTTPGCSGLGCFPQYIAPFENYTMALIVIIIIAIGSSVWFVRRK